MSNKDTILCFVMLPFQDIFKIIYYILPKQTKTSLKGYQ